MIGALMMLSPVLRRLGRSWPRHHRLRLDGSDIDWWAENDADLGILEEVFARRVYDLTDVAPPALIVDLGAHIGATVLLFTRRFPDAHVIAAEPDPLNFLKLQRNVGSLPNVTLRNVAVGARNEHITLYSAGRLDSWKSSTHQTTPWQEPIVVESVTLDDLIADAGYEHADVLKIDIEGSEVDVLEAFAGLGSVSTILGEVHPRLINRSVGDFLALLRGFTSDLAATVEEDTPFRADRVATA